MEDLVRFGFDQVFRSVSKPGWRFEGTRPAPPERGKLSEATCLLRKTGVSDEYEPTRVVDEDDGDGVSPAPNGEEEEMDIRQMIDITSCSPDFFVPSPRKWIPTRRSHPRCHPHGEAVPQTIRPLIFIEPGGGALRSHFETKRDQSEFTRDEEPKPTRSSSTITRTRKINSARTKTQVHAASRW